MIVVTIGVTPVGFAILAVVGLGIGSTFDLVGAVAQIAIVTGGVVGRDRRDEHEDCHRGNEDLLHPDLLTIEWDIHSRGAPNTDQTVATTLSDLVVVARTRSVLLVST